MTHDNLPNGSDENTQHERQDYNVKAGLAQMLKGGVIMDVVNVEQVIAPFPRSSLPLHSTD